MRAIGKQIRKYRNEMEIHRSSSDVFWEFRRRRF